MRKCPSLPAPLARPGPSGAHPATEVGAPAPLEDPRAASPSFISKRLLVVQRRGGRLERRADAMNKCLPCKPSSDTVREPDTGGKAPWLEEEAEDQGRFPSVFSGEPCLSRAWPTARAPREEGTRACRPAALSLLGRRGSRPPASGHLRPLPQRPLGAGQGVLGAVSNQRHRSRDRLAGTLQGDLQFRKSHP